MVLLPFRDEANLDLLTKMSVKDIRQNWWSSFSLGQRVHLVERRCSDEEPKSSTGDHILLINISFVTSCIVEYFWRRTIYDHLSPARSISVRFDHQVQLENVGVEEDRNYTCIPYNKVQPSHDRNHHNHHNNHHHRHHWRNHPHLCSPPGRERPRSKR